MNRRTLLAGGLTSLNAAAAGPVIWARNISVTLDPAAGGEIASVRHQGKELLYRALQPDPPTGWRGRAPWLWPAVGRNFAAGQRPDGGNNVTGSYEWNGKRYRMPIHGFARSRAWTLKRARVSSAVLQLDVPADPEVYPWAAGLHVEYEVGSGGIHARFHVTASKNNDSPMPFSAGNHITFNAPLTADGGEMQWSTNGSRVYLKSAEGVPNGDSRPREFHAPSPVAAITKEYPLSIGGYGNGEAWLRIVDTRKRAITISHHATQLPADPVLRFNLWGTPECISPEPWVGMQNSFNSRNGLIYLEPGKSWSWFLRIVLEA